MITSYTVLGMTCAHCEHRVSGEIKEIPGVADATADSTTGSVVVTSAAEIDVARVRAAVEEAGYDLAVE